MPEGELEILPADIVPVLVTVKVYLGNKVKVAVQVVLADKAKALAHFEGLHPVKVDPVVAVAVGVTAVPEE
jgi:hypothetical protein